MKERGITIYIHSLIPKRIYNFCSIVMRGITVPALNSFKFNLIPYGLFHFSSTATFIHPERRAPSTLCMCTFIGPLNINNFKLYQRNVIPPVILDPPPYRNEIFCKVDKSSNPSPCVYHTNIFFRPIRRPSFISFNFLFIWRKSPERMSLQGTVTHREYNSKRLPVFQFAVSLIQLFVCVHVTLTRVRSHFNISNARNIF